MGGKTQQQEKAERGRYNQVALGKTWIPDQNVTPRPEGTENTVELW